VPDTRRMTLLNDALRAAAGPSVHRAPALRRVLVAGGAGSLGAAVLEQLLARRSFAQVGVLVTQSLGVALRGLHTVDASALDHSAGSEDTAVIVFDRERHANGREQAFLRPEPAHLTTLAAAFRRRGVRSLIVVMPHASATLPEALKHGLANLDEQAVASLAFDHLLFVRSAQASRAIAGRSVGQRVADWVLAQLQLMIPQRGKPVRPVKVAQFVAELAAQLPDSPAGTRVVPPELVWEAAQQRDMSAVTRTWLRADTVPASTLRPPRM
jgi:hypothetical protein